MVVIQLEGSFPGQPKSRDPFWLCAEELDGEFLDLHATHMALEGSKGQSAEAFLAELRSAAQPG